MAALRAERGITQDELARRLDITRQMVAYYERRAENPTAEFILKVAEVFGVSVEDLLGSGGPPAARRKPGPASKLERQIDEVKKLPRTKQRVVVELLDAFLQRATG